MRGQIAVALCLVAAIVAGCGSSSGDDDGVTTPAVTRAPTAITIEAPADGARLKATLRKDGTLRARTRVRGRAQAGSPVSLSAACRLASCRAETRAGDDGRWAATLTLSVPRAARFVTIDANLQREGIAAGSAVATIELVGPARARRRRAGASGSSRARSSDAPAGGPQRPPSRARLRATCS